VGRDPGFSVHAVLRGAGKPAGQRRDDDGESVDPGELHGGLQPLSMSWPAKAGHPVNTDIAFVVAGDYRIIRFRG
jgi:hypothetical protein